MTLKIGARGIPPPSYQWYFNGNAIVEEQGGCSDQLHIIGFSEADVGVYVCRVFNDAGVVMTRDIEVTLIPESLRVRGVVPSMPLSLRTHLGAGRPSSYLRPIVD